MAKENSGSLIEKFVPVLLITSFLLAFVVGILWQKVVNLEGGGTKTKALGNTEETNDAPAPGPAAGKLTADQAKKLPALADSDHVFGSRDAQILLIEYSDLQCPFCQKFHPTVKQALSEYGDKVAWVYRHFPLEAIHPRAKPSAIASECVASLGGNDAFWKFTDTVFTDQNKYLTDEGLSEAAGIVGVNKGAFDECYKANRGVDIVEAQAKGGTEAGVNGTPATFIVNKKGDVWLFSGAGSYDNFKAMIEEALKS